MSTLEIVFISGAVATIISFLCVLYFFFTFIQHGTNLNKLPTKKVKNRKKNKRLKLKRDYLTKKKRKSLHGAILAVLLTLLFAGGSFYVSYYQSMALTKKDSDTIVEGYYLLRDFKEQLTLAKNEEGDTAVVQQDMRYLATRLASIGTQKANSINTQEGQLIMNRYYNALKQIGINASSQIQKLYGNQELVDDFLADIERAQFYEKEVIRYYKVDEKALKEK